MDQQSDTAILCFSSNAMVVQSSTPSHGLYFDSTEEHLHAPIPPLPILSRKQPQVLLHASLGGSCPALLTPATLPGPPELCMKYELWSSHSTTHDGSAHTHTHTPKEKLGTRNWLIFSLKRVPESSLSPGLQALTFIICLIFKDLCWFRNSYKQYLKIMIQSQESYIVLHLFLSAL